MPKIIDDNPSFPAFEATDRYGDVAAFELTDGYLVVTAREDGREVEVDLSEAVAGQLVAFLNGLGLPALADSPSPASVDADPREALDRAIEEGDEVCFRYRKENGELSDREVEPHETFESLDGHELVVGYDFDADGPRAFRLDRIEGPVTVG